MKHLITNYDGGFPFDLDDYRFMEDGFNEDITSILKAYQYQEQDSSFGVPPPNSFIIYGCEIIPVTYTPPGGGMSTAGYGWTAGAVMIDGVIYKVNAKTTPSGMGFLSPGSAFYFNTSVIFDSAGNEAFKNGTSYNTYGIRTATPTVQSIGTGVNKLVFDSFTPRFMSGVWSGEKEFTIVGSSGAPAYNSPWTYGTLSAPALGFRKLPNHDVELRGYCERPAGSSTGGQRIFTLPPAYRPNSVLGEMHFSAMDRYTGDMYLIFISPGGGVYAHTTNTFPNSVLFELSSVRFSTL